MKKHLFWFSIVFALVLQVCLGFYETYGDIPSYFIPWATSIEKFGTTGFYSRIIPPNSYPNYPPLIVLVLTAFHLLGRALIKPILDGLWNLNISIPYFPSGLVTFFGRDNLLIYSFIKLPNIISNILLAIGSYKLAQTFIPKKSKSNLPAIVFVSILFNPALIFLGALWGQVDTIPFMFVVWSFYFIHKKNFRLSIFLITLALLSKQTAIMVLPFYFLHLANSLSFRRVIEAGLIVYLTIVGFFLPFQKTLIEILFPFFTYLKIAGSFASNLVSMHAHNFWQLVMPGMKDNGVRGVSQILVFGFMMYIISVIWKKRNKLKFVLSGLAIFGVFSFMFLTRMHERHLMIAIPFMVFAPFLDLRFYRVYIFETLYLLANMYAAWPIPRIEWLNFSLNFQPIVSFIVIIQLAVLLWMTVNWHKTVKNKI